MAIHIHGDAQVEKLTQANVIRLLEEANATRSLLNTAKLPDDNPILMRLKEWETLEKITKKIDKLTCVWWLGRRHAAIGGPELEQRLGAVHGRMTSGFFSRISL